MLSSDLPVEKINEDKLKRSSFAEGLAKTLVEYSAPSSLTVGLYGKWGSGKTSILNMVFENVERIDDSIVVFRFNPWLCSDSNQLITQFFKQMATAIKLKKKKSERVWELIDQYADIFDATSLIPVVGGGVTAFFKTIARKAGKQVERREKDLQKSKNQIIEKLNEENIKIIVSIDDIDRLSEVEIVAIFQLVKSLADFPNTIYILAFDYSVVVRALEKVQCGDGRGYLEKIIQIPFEIPVPNMTDIHNVLFSQLNDILGFVSEENWERETWIELFHNGIGNYITSIRDVIRYVNVFSFKYELLKNETNPIDLLGLICLQVFEPNVYSKLPSYKEILCGDNRGYSHEYQQEIEEQIRVAIKSIIPDDESTKNPEAAKSIVGVLFPGIKSNVGLSYSMGRNYSSMESFVRNSIANPECFDRYFALTLEDGAIPTAKVKYLIYEADESEFNKEIVQIYREGKIVRMLEAIEAYAKREPFIKDDRAAIIVRSLSYNWASFEVVDEGFFAVPFVWRMLYCIDPLLRGMNQVTRFSLVRSIFENENIQVSMLALMLQDFERQHGRFTENNRKLEGLLFTLEQVLKLEMAFEKNAVKAIDSKEILQCKYSATVWWLLKQIDPEVAEKKRKSFITDDISLVKIVDAYMTRGSATIGGYTKIRKLDKNGLNGFIDVDQAYQRVKKFRDSEHFLELSKDEQMSAVAFLLIMENNGALLERDCVSEHTIAKEISQSKQRCVLED